MAVYIVTPTNWSDPAFWAEIALDPIGNTLDFSGLYPTFDFEFNPTSGLIAISDGVTTFTVGDSTFGGSSDTSLGDTNLLDLFSAVTTGSGDDTLIGADTADDLDDDTGADQLIGRGGNDTLSSGSDADTLLGGTGDDLMSGGSGDDTFVLEEVAEGMGQLILDGAGQSAPEWDGAPDLINQSTATDQSPPKMLLLDDGRVLYVWHDEGAADNTLNMEVQGRIFNADGTPSTDQFQIGTWAIDGNNAYDIDTFDLVQADNGNVFVGYVRSSSETGGDEPVMSVIDPSFSPGQPGFDVATDIEIQQVDPSSSAESPPILTALSDRRVLAIWNNNALSDNNTNMEVQGRIFDADGTPAGSQFTVSTTAIDGSNTYDVQQMDVVETADGNVWIGFVSNTAEAGTDSPIATVIDPSVAVGQPGFIVAQDVEIQQTEGASY